MSSKIRDERALIGYCYGVAGTVGVMMTSVLGGTDRRAAPHAIDLDIATQLTNICRDVREDAGVVPPLARVGWALVGLWEGVKALVTPAHPHERTLHDALRGLPGADSRSA